ncbi:hypothetical protein ACFL57_05265 [Candidatus Margulisiibacteriota bacterium]
MSKYKFLLPLLFFAVIGINAAALEVSLITPADMLVTYEKEINCRAILSEPADIVINKEIRLHGDRLERDIPLKIGKNLILIETFQNGLKKSIQRRVLRLARFEDVPERHWAKKQIEQISTITTDQQTNRPNTDLNIENNFLPDAAISRKDFYSWINALTGFHFNTASLPDKETAVNVKDAVTTIALFKGWEIKDQTATADIQDFISLHYNQNNVRDLSIYRQLSRAEIAYLIGSIPVVQENIADLYNWETYTAAIFQNAGYIQVLGKQILPKKISLNEGPSFLLRIKINNPALIDNIVADFSSLGWNAKGNVLFILRDTGWYETKGLVKPGTQPGLHRIPCFIKQLNGETHFEEFISWITL